MSDKILAVTGTSDKILAPTGEVDIILSPFVWTGYCPWCPDETPSQYVDVTFAGVSVCPGCYIEPKLPGSKKYEWFNTLNTTYRVPYNLFLDGVCYWTKYDEEDIIRQRNFQYYSDCVTNEIGSYYYGAYILVDRKEPDLMRVRAQIPGVPFHSLFDTGWVSVETPETNCVKVTNAANFLVEEDCDLVYEIPYAYGGTVTVTEV